MYLMIVIHSIRYKKIKEDKVSYPLYIYFALFPFVSEVKTPNMDIILKIVFILGFLGLLFSRQRKFKFNKYEIGYFVVVILPILLNYNRIEYAKASIAIVNLGFIFMVSFYAFNDINTGDKLKQILNLFVINSVFLSACIIFEYFFLGITRPEASMMNPNYLAFYLIISFMCGIYIRNVKKVYSVLYLCLCIFAIYLTGSHSIFLALLIVLFFRLVVYRSNKFMKRLFIILIILAAIFYIFIVIFIGDTNYGLLRYFVKSDDLIRIYIWKNAWETFKENLFFGVGWGCYSYVNGFTYGDKEWVTHNDFLRIMVEVGAFGLLVMGMYLNKLIKNLVSYTNHKVFFLGSLFVILFSMSLAHNNMNSILFWWTLSLPLYKNCFEIKSI